MHGPIALVLALATLPFAALPPHAGAGGSKYGTTPGARDIAGSAPAWRQEHP